MLTIFSSPRPFRGEFDTIQRNAIRSWLAFCPGCEIMLVGDDEGTEKAATDFKLKYIPQTKRNEKGVILRNSVFEEARKAANNDLLCFINADILLTGSFLNVVSSIRFPAFLLSVRRWDLDIKESIDFTDSSWSQALLGRLKQQARLHGFSAGDFFVFPRSLDIKMPPFSVKHGGWDNWFIYRLKSLGLPVIDATEAITIIHQNHNGHHQKEVKSLWRTEEGKKELGLAGGFSSMLTLRDADWLIDSSLKLKKPGLFRRIFSSLSLFYPWRQLLALKRRIQQYI
jgi:hypothetical protein